MVIRVLFRRGLYGCRASFEPQWRFTGRLRIITRPGSPAEDSRGSTNIIIGAIIGGIVLLALVVGGVIFLLQPGTPTERIRDIFIIFMALVMLLVGVALVLLIAQLASLINLLRNEVKPILVSTNETANTLRGTTAFLSDHLVEPVIQLSSAVAALRTLVGFQQLFRRK
jgi:hypothetical protein